MEAEDQGGDTGEVEDGPDPEHVLDPDEAGGEDDGVGRGGDGEEEGVPRRQPAAQHQVERVDGGGPGQLQHDGEEHGHGGRVGHDLEQLDK